MHLLLVGNEARADEMRRKLSSANPAIEYHSMPIFRHETIAATHHRYDIIIDLSFDSYPDALAAYNLPDKPVLVSAVCHSLAAAVAELDRPLRCQLIGINALPTFIDRPLWEISLPDPSPQYRQAAQQLFNRLQIDYRLIDDRVGMATPRVVSMIINEAYYLLQERGAAANDIDAALKLGVNYPYGPFEWAEKIGIANIAQTLEAVYHDTHDERYKICPLLKKAALVGQ